MEIIAQTNVYQEPQAYYRMPQGDRLQDDLDYGINGSVNSIEENKIKDYNKSIDEAIEEANEKDYNYTKNAIVILVALIGGFMIYKNFNKK
jgi:hypothetical protein